MQFAAAGRQKDRLTDSQTQKESRERERDPIDLRKRMFYDLSLGYEGVEDQTRREVVAMALQLGYTGVATNHMLTGIMADSDRSRIKPLELSSVIAPALGEQRLQNSTGACSRLQQLSLSDNSAESQWQSKIWCGQLHSMLQILFFGPMTLLQ